MMLEQVLGWTATIMFTVKTIPQIVKTLRTRSVEGVSLWLFFLNFTANLVALWYASLITQPALQVKYTLDLIMTAAYIGIYFKYR